MRMIIVCSYCTLPKKTPSKKERDYFPLTHPKPSHPHPPLPLLQPVPLQHLPLDSRLVILQSIERPRLVYHQKAQEARHRQLPLQNGEHELGGERVDASVGARRMTPT